MAGKKIKTAAADAPKTQAEAEVLLLDIGTLQRRVAALEIEMNDRLAAIKAEYEQRAQPYNDELDAKFRALHAWAEAHRDELLVGRGKTARLASGELSWRTSPPAVRITGVDAVLAALKRLGLTRFIRTKEEVAKDLILAESDAVKHVKGISITQKEEFVAKPFESEIERAEPAQVTVSAVEAKAS